MNTHVAFPARSSDRHGRALRDLEAKLAGALAQKLLSQVLSEARGQPTNKTALPLKVPDRLREHRRTLDRVLSHQPRGNHRA